jgi:hypothetical protein
MLMRDTITRLARAALWSGGILSVIGELGSAASATPVTYVLTGDLSATLGTTTLSDAAFTWTITGDTTALTTAPTYGFPEVPAITDVIDISGLGDVEPTPQMFVAIYEENAAFIDGTSRNGITWVAAALSTWDAVTPIGPVNVQSTGFAPLATDLGLLTNEDPTNLVFTETAGAPVPEPGTLGLLLGPIAGLIGWGARGATRRARRSHA